MQKVEVPLNSVITMPDGTQYKVDSVFYKYVYTMNGVKTRECKHCTKQTTVKQYLDNNTQPFSIGCFCGILFSVLLYCLILLTRKHE
jgi:hypothetical protein